MNTAVLFLIFKRPDPTRRVWEAIRAARPPRLYIAADGPRASRAGEAALCEETRRIAAAVDWPCAVKTLFREENLGCRRAVSQAVSWFFEHEEQGIILEDDCLPDPSFFPFVEEMLERYLRDERIMAIGGVHFHRQAHQPPESYFFSRHNHCWGWATWRRGWKLYDDELTTWPDLRDKGWLREIGCGSLLFRRYWTSIFDRVHANEINSWAYRWTFSCWTRNGLTVLPSRNLVANIGINDAATNTKDGSPKEWIVPLEQLDFPLVHPRQVVRDAQADAWTDRHIFKISPGQEAVRTIKKIVRMLIKHFR